MAKAPAKKSVAKKSPRVVAGAGTAVKTKDPARSSSIEKAMSAAVAKAMDEGVSDPAEIKERMMAARAEVLKG